MRATSSRSPVRPSTYDGVQKTGSTDPVVTLRRQRSAARSHPRARRPPRREVRDSTAPARPRRWQHRPDRVAEHPHRRLRRLLPGLEVLARHLQGRRDQVPRSATKSRRASTGSSRTARSIATRAAPASSTTKLTSGGVIYLPPPLLRQRSRARLRRATIPTTYQPLIPLTTEPQTDEQLVLRAGQLARGLELHDQRRRPLGTSGSRRSRRQHRRSISPTTGRRVSASSGTSRRNGRSKLFGNWGRFYESIPMDINIRAFGGEATCFCYNFDPNPLNTVAATRARRSARRCSAARRRSIRTSRVSTPTSSSSAASTKWRAT